jgi:hypothetical protein
MNSFGINIRTAVLLYLSILRIAVIWVYDTIITPSGAE